LVKFPPTNKLLPEHAIAFTLLLNPEPSADHADPFQIAILFAVMPSACVNAPPAQSLSPYMPKAVTLSFIPEPNPDQPVPSHLAM
jgi:hypothetical protein